MTKKKSAFDKWFEDQYGDLPMSRAKGDRLFQKLRNARATYQALQAEVDRDSELKDNYTVASYVWNIKDSEKK